MESFNWIDFISAACARWYHWKWVLRIQLMAETQPIEAFMFSCFGTDVLYTGGKKARVSHTCAMIEPYKSYLNQLDQTPQVVYQMGIVASVWWPDALRVANQWQIRKRDAEIWKSFSGSWMSTSVPLIIEIHNYRDFFRDPSLMIFDKIK